MYNLENVWCDWNIRVLTKKILPVQKVPPIFDDCRLYCDFDGTCVSERLYEEFYWFATELSKYCQMKLSDHTVHIRVELLRKNNFSWRLIQHLGALGASYLCERYPENGRCN